MKEKYCLICCIIGFIIMMVGGAMFNVFYLKTPEMGFGAFLASVGCLLIGIGYGNIIGRSDLECQEEET